MPTDLQIARSVTGRPIVDVAADLGLAPADLIPYGHDKAKILPLKETREPGKLILVSAITPTPAGEGKTTTSVGLALAVRIREAYGTVEESEIYAIEAAEDAAEARAATKGDTA